MFGLFEKKSVPITDQDMIKLMPADKSHFEGLNCDENVPRDLYRVTNVEVTMRRQSIERKLVRCRDAVKTLIPQIKKRQMVVYYVAPKWFTLEVKDGDGSRVRCNARFNITPETSIGLADWLELNVRKAGEFVSVDEVSRLLSGKGKPDWLEIKDPVLITEPKPEEEDIKEEKASNETVETLTIGSVLFNRWEILKEIGEGGMGKVYLAKDKMTPLEENSKVVVKVMHIETAHDPYAVEQFVKEAKILKGLRHKYIASLEDCLMLGDTPIIIMEYIEGESMFDYLNQHGCVLDEKMTKELLYPMAQALDYAHSEKIFHLDVKPQNIMVRKSMKSGARTCLLDFGIAKKAHADGSMTFTMSVAGTPLYMSQEQRNGEPANAAMDVYALAVTAYECLMGEMPYPHGQSMSYSVRPIPSDTPFARAVMRGLDINPANRPRSCEELINPPRDAVAPPKVAAGGGKCVEPVVAHDGDGRREEKKIVATPQGSDSFSDLSKTFSNYRQMLAQSANRTMRTNPEHAEWMRERQAALRDLTKDVAAISPDELVIFFTDVKSKLSELKISPNDFFIAADRLNELRCGLPKEGGRVWEAICNSVK